MINNIPTRTAKPDALTALLRSDLPALGEIEVRLVESTPTRSGEADALTQYMNQAARWPRLGAEEELSLGRRIKAGKQADGQLTPSAQAAFDELVNRNLRLPYHAAQQMRVPREEMLELISAGNAALLDAERGADIAGATDVMLRALEVRTARTRPVLSRSAPVRDPRGR